MLDSPRSAAAWVLYLESLNSELAAERGHKGHTRACVSEAALVGETTASSPSHTAAFSSFRIRVWLARLYLGMLFYICLCAVHG